MSAEPTRMTEADWQPLRDLGFDDESLLEVGHIVALFNYYTRLADGFGLQVDPEVEMASQTGVALRHSGE
jgi:alkylhydroperoxidase family enzyme